MCGRAHAFVLIFFFEGGREIVFVLLGYCSCVECMCLSMIVCVCVCVCAR